MSNVDAENAILCSYLGLTTRDLAEIGSFSDRFARDLLAGRRAFPQKVQKSLHNKLEELALLKQVMYEQSFEDDTTIYIYRTLEQLRSSPVGKVVPNVTLGQYRLSAYEVMIKCKHEGRALHFRFASTPEVNNAKT